MICEAQLHRMECVAFAGTCKSRGIFEKNFVAAVD